MVRGGGKEVRGERMRVRWYTFIVPMVRVR
jgi:hypothetical protein